LGLGGLNVLFAIESLPLATNTELLRGAEFFGVDLPRGTEFLGVALLRGADFFG